MAEEKDISLYMAGGNKIFRQMERLTAKQEKVANQQQQIVNEELKEKAQSVSSIKRVSELQGNPVTTKAIKDTLGSLGNLLSSRIKQLEMASAKTFLPIDSQIKRIGELLKSDKEDDQDEAFKIIDRLEKLGIDLSRYNKQIGEDMRKISAMNQERNQIHNNKITELKQEREILRERGINTYINEKEYKLELRTKQQEKIEKKEIIKKEQQLQDRQKELQFELKQIQKENTIDKDREERILAEYEDLRREDEKLKERKEKAGFKEKERVSGPLDQTVGEAYRQIKGFGKEIVQLGGDLFKGFGKLAAGVGRVAMAFLALLKPLIPFILIAVMIGVVIFALYKIIKSVIDFFADIFDGISKIWPFSLLKGDDNKNEEVGDPNKTAVPGQEDKISPQYETDIQKRTGQAQMVNRNEIDGETVADRKAFDTGRDSDAMKILPINAEGGEDRRSISQMTRNVRTQNLNKMSVENQALNESKPTNNTVVAPNISNSSVNASNTQAMTMEPTNFDRSFINLNTVPV